MKQRENDVGWYLKQGIPGIRTQRHTSVLTHTIITSITEQHNSTCEIITKPTLKAPPLSFSHKRAAAKIQDITSDDGCGDDSNMDGNDVDDVNDGKRDDDNDDADNAIMTLTNFLPELTKTGLGAAALKSSKTIS